MFFLSHQRIFHSYGDIIITGEELQILTYAQLSQQMSSEGSLVCHTSCYMGHPFMIWWSSLRNPDTLTYCSAIGSGASHYLFQT